MGSAQLTTGVCNALLDGSHDSVEDPPVMQVLGVIKLRQDGSSNLERDRFRIVLSDGEKFVNCMLATQLNYLIETDNLKDGDLSIIRLDDYIANTIRDVPIIIVLEMKILRKNHGTVIGNPTDAAGGAGE